MNGLRRFIEAIERRGTTPWTPLVAAAWIAGLRITEEHLLINIPRVVRRDPEVWLGHVTLFYLALLFCISAMLWLVTGRDPRRIQTAVAAALSLGVLPPLIDGVVYGAGGFNYAYQPLVQTGIPFLLYVPPMQLPIGETVVLWSTIALVAFYTRITGATWVRVAVAAVAQYGLILLFLVFVPWLALTAHTALSTPSINEMIGFLLLCAAAAGLGLQQPVLARRLAARLPQILLAPSLTLVGSALIGRVDGHTLVAAAAMTVAAAVFALHNDHYDVREDEAAGRAELLSRDQVILVSTLTVPWWLTVSQGHFWPMLFGLLFFVVGFAYHADPYRLKCVFPLSYKTEAFLALLCLGAGVLTHPPMLLTPAHVLAILAIAAGASLVAMLKDFKDVDADAAAEVRTVYVVCGARGWSARATHRVVSFVVAGALTVPALWIWLSAGQPVYAGVLVAIGATIVGVFFVVQSRVAATWTALLLLSAYLVVGALGLLRAGGIA